jgi:Tol biopolymer transport system component
VFGNRNFDLWLMDDDGNNRAMLTTDEHSNRDPFVTPDGKHIVFESWRKSKNGQKCGMWIMTVQGANPTFLAPTQCHVTASCSGECPWIIYDLYPKGIWKIPIGGGTPVQIIKNEAFAPAISPDGSKIACFLMDRSNSEIPVIAIYPAEGGVPTRIFRTSPNVEGKALHWSPDGNAIAFIKTEAGVSNLWIQPTDNSPAKQITNFDSDQIFSFDWSKDGKIAIARGKSQNDVMLITTGD